MLKSPILFAVSVLIALVHWTSVAKAQAPEFGLSFELPPAKTHTAAIETVVETQPPAPPQEPTPTDPVRIEIAELSVAAPLPPLAAVQTPKSDKQTTESASSESRSEVANTETIELLFAKDTLSLEALANEQENQPGPLSESTTGLLFNETTELLSSSASEYNVSTGVDNWGATIGLDEMFENGTHSLVARTVGSAEGTRQSDGRHTQAYYGHVDPGNGVWNLGTFSYQHEATSPEEADEKQLRRLKRQGLELEAQAQKQGFTLSLEEKLNGLDLANQAPLAALDRGGYIDRLAQAKRLQMATNEAILWARTHSYIDPDTRQWNAPGLGNNIHSISRDQDRRMVAISDALNTYDPTEVDESSLATATGVSLPANELNSQTHRLAALGSPEIAQHVLAEIEVSFGLPPAEASLPLVANTAQPLPSTTDREAPIAAENNETTALVASTNTGQIQGGNDIGFDLLPTGSLTALTREQTAEAGAEEVSAEEASAEGTVEMAQSDVTETTTASEHESPETEVAMTNTPVAPQKSPDTDPEPTNKLQDLLSGIPERTVPDRNTVDANNTSSARVEPEASGVTDEPGAVERPPLWHTEDRIIHD